MSKITLSGNASGTGTLTIASPNTNSDRTLTLPDSTGTIATAESTLAQFSASGSAPVYAARAWVNFNGTGTVAIRASGNVSSITDNGTGDYTVNFTTAMQDTNYCPVYFAEQGASNAVIATVKNLGRTDTISVHNVVVVQGTTRLDWAQVMVAIFR